MESLPDYIKRNLQEVREYIPTPLDVSKETVDAIVLAIICQVNLHRDCGDSSNKSFYAGICNDVDQNMKRHCNNSYAALVNCGTREKAGEVETELGRLGFDVGERPNNGGKSNTTIVYVIKKDKNFKRG